jgi:hypothetical protein
VRRRGPGRPLSDPGPELRIPGVAREYAAGHVVDLGDHVGCGAATDHVQHPLRIGGDREPARAIGPIRERQARDLDGVIRRHELQQIQRDAVGGVLEATISLSVSNDIRPGFFPDRQAGRTPGQPAVLVAHVEHFTRRVADRIVRPRCQLVLPTVVGPGVASPRLGDVEAEARVRHDVDPGSWCPLSLAKHGDVLPAVGCEPSDAVEVREIERRRWHRLWFVSWRPQPGRHRPGP